MKVHVLICSHNGESYFEEQLISITSQVNSDTVINIHDFNSRDKTTEVANKIAGLFPGKIKLTYHPDAPGASQSFFRAISILAAEVSGDDCIFFSDQDDVWLPRKFERVRQEFLNQMRGTVSGCVAIFHDVMVVDEKLNTLRTTYYTGIPFSIPRDLHADRLLLANPVIGHTMAVSGKLLKIVANVRDPSGYLMHDWATVLFALHLGKICFVPEKLSLYRQHSSNVLGAYGSRKVVSYSRKLFRFSQLACMQARVFSRDIGVYSENKGLLKFLSKARLISCYLRLTVSAFRYGPTFKRKMLGFFLFGNAILTLFLTNH